MSDLGRRLLAEELRRRYGATADAGTPTAVPDGLHLLAATNAEVRAALDVKRRDPAATFVDVQAFVTADRAALYEAGAQVLALHASDLTVPDGYLPQPGPDVAAPNMGQALAVADGFAVAHVLMCDSRVTPGEWVTADYAPLFDTVSNVWVAHRHRRAGIARALLEHARGAYPLVELQRPFTPAGSAWATVCAPDLVDVGRNSRCPCGSGVKFKRCCGGKRAA